MDNLYAYTGMRSSTKTIEDLYNYPECTGHRMICFWRPIHMVGPVKMKPLALCDPESVRIEDMIASSLIGLSPLMKPSSMGSLRFHPGHKWFYYPDMTNNEVIAFK